MLDGISYETCSHVTSYGCYWLWLTIDHGTTGWNNMVSYYCITIRY